MPGWNICGWKFDTGTNKHFRESPLIIENSRGLRFPIRHVSLSFCTIGCVFDLNSSSLNPSISRHCGASWYFCQNIFCTFLSKLVPSCHFCAILNNLKKHFRYWFHFSLLHETPYLDVKLIHFFHPFHHLVPRSCCPVKHKGMGGRSKGSNFSWANNASTNPRNTAHRISFDECQASIECSACHSKMHRTFKSRVPMQIYVYI